MSNLNDLAQACHQDSVRRGFHSEPQDPSQTLLLIISEAVEAMEEIRAGHGLNEAYWQYISTNDCYAPDLTINHQGTIVFDGTPAAHLVTHEDYVAWGWQCKPVGVPSEMADLIIRALEACVLWGIDIEKAIRLKREYNSTRGYMNDGKRF